MRPDGGGFRVFGQDSYGEAPEEASGSEFARTPGVLCPASLWFLLFSWQVTCTTGFCTPAARAALEQVAVVQQPVQHGGDGGAVAEQLAPVVDGSVRCNQRAGPLIAAHDDFQQFLGRRDRQLAHAEIVNDQ